MLIITIFGQRWFIISILSLIRSTGADDKFAESYNCCLNNQVPDNCARNLCRPPDDWSAYQDDAAYYLPAACSRHLDRIGRCLSNGRNNSACCSRNGEEPYTMCLHMCSGDAFTVDLSRSKNLEYEYSSCLIQHSRKTLMPCAADGYAYIPTPPVNLRAVDIGSDYAVIEWEPPTHLPHLVTSYVIQYKIIHESRNVDPTWQRAASTADLRYHLKNLTPDTSYAFDIVAETATVGNMSSHSQSTIFTTKGDLPAVTPYDAEVRAAVNSPTLLICRVEVQGQRERALKVDWYFRANVESNFRTVDTRRLETDFFFSQDVKLSGNVKTYAAILRIKNLVNADYGTYKCEATNDYGTARGFITLKSLHNNGTALQMPRSPPNLTECCSKSGVSKDCLFICQSDPEQRLTALNIRHKKCHTQIPLVEKCINPPVKNQAIGACCLNRRLPWHCIPVCEQGVPFLHNRHSARDRHVMVQCLKNASAIFQCQLQYKSQLPYPPTQLDVTYFSELKIDKLKRNRSSPVVNVKWRKSPLADRYFIYYRRIKPQESQEWTRVDDVRESQTNLHNLTPTSTYTLVILAANAQGHSYSSRSIEFLVT